MASREAQVSRLFVELADTLVNDFDVADFLLRLVESSLELLDIDAAGVMLADQRGGLQLVASSPEEMAEVELFELQADEGPCLDTFRSGAPVLSVTLDDAYARWPRFAAAAEQSGWTATHALPLRLRGQVIGAMNLFSASAQPLSEADVDLGQALADVATIGLLQQRAIHDQVLLAEQLQSALDSRVVLEQAKGVLAERLGVSPAEAFGQLRTYARQHRRSLHELALSVIDGSLRELGPVTQPER